MTTENVIIAIATGICVDRQFIAPLFISVESRGTSFI
jgi:hypothetical protein